jgi:hypothetical protein
MAMIACCRDKPHLSNVAEDLPTVFRDYCSKALLGNKSFMLQAVSMDGELIRIVDEPIRFDFHLMLAAFASKNHLAKGLIEADVQ